jgi:beta-fructofuranosidase
MVYSQGATEDYTSQVPQFKFSQTRDKQEEELKNNPLMIRFAKSRIELSSDRHRPIYHFTNPEGDLNDPHGLCFWQGEWHLFYQAYPPEDPRQHWGHAISQDLIHWRDLPYAIYPNPEKMCFSGTIWVEDKRAIAMYMGVDAGEMVAISDDPLLLNWEKLTGGPVISNPKEGEPRYPFNLWDPCIWSNDGVYYALIGGIKKTGPEGKQMRAHYLLKSDNLTDWEYLHPFVENDDYSLVGDDGACPNFWPIGNHGKHLMVHFSHMSGGKFLIGDYDTLRNKFIVTNGGRFNHGPVHPGGICAPSSYPDGKGGIYCIFKLGGGLSMTMPVLLTTDEYDQLYIEPAGDYESLRKDHNRIKGMYLPANKEIVLNEIKGNALEMNAIIDTKQADYVEVNVRRSPEKEEYTRIIFYRDRGYHDPGWSSMSEKPNSAICIDNSNSSLLPGKFSRIPETADVFIGKDELVELHIFIDKSSVEVFVNGRQFVALRAMPSLEESVGVSVRAHGGDANLKSLDAWQMKNIY